jgi:hypothetical protein
MEYKKLIKKIKKAEKDCSQWEERAQSLTDRYADKRAMNSYSDDRRLNIFWSNVQLLQPAYFANMPIPNITKRFSDSSQVALDAAEVLKKAVDYEMDDPVIERTLNAVLKDRLLVGRGVARLDFSSDMKETPEGQAVNNEDVVLKYVHWRDFLILGSPRNWDEVTAICFKSYVDEDQFNRRFEGETGKPVGDDGESLTSNTEEYTAFKKGKVCIYEVWDKSENMVYWVSNEISKILDKSEPLIDVKGFFPCPRPLYATLTNDSLIPIPDFVFYQDQADEVDLLTTKINQTVGSLKVAGVYAGDSVEIKRLISSTSHNEMIPVKDFAMLQSNGGVKGMIEWFPLKDILTALAEMFNTREKVINEIYQITGISDILRGQSDSRETATAQKIKSDFATLRLSQQQKNMASFCRDSIELMAEVIADIYSPETLTAISNTQVTEEVINILRNDLLRSFVIDVEIDSTIEVNHDEVTQQRLNFIESAGQFLVTMLPIVQEVPELGKLVGDMLMFGTQSFKAAAPLEATIKELMETLGQQEPNGGREAQEKQQVMQQQQQQQMAVQQQQQQAMMQQQAKEQAEFQMKQQDMQLKAAQQQIDVQVKSKELQQKDVDAQLKAKEMMIKQQMGSGI